MFGRRQRAVSRQEMMHHRLHVLWLIVFLLFVMLILRLSWVQLGEGEKYRKQAEENNFKQISVLAPRGNIYDRSGKKLVGNKSLFAAIYLETDDPAKDKMNTAKKLSKGLKMPLKEVLEKMDIGLDAKGNQVPRNQPPYYPKKIKDRLSEKEVVKISENPTDYKGVNIILEPLRQYRDDTFAVQTIGYVRPFAGAKTSMERYKNAQKQSDQGGYLDWEQVGMDGIEYSFQDDLRGENGYRLVRVNSSGKLVDVIKEVHPKPGSDLYMTLDEKMQLETEQYIESHLHYLRTQAPGRDRAPYAKNAYAVAMEVDTGKIRAMVSYPDYDPNIWNGPVSAKAYQDLTPVIRNGTITAAPYDARGYANPDKEYNRHPFSVLPPGSTFKPMTTLMALDKGLVAPYTMFQDPGTYYYAPSTPPVRNSGQNNYGALNARKALQKSANTYFAWIANMWHRQEGKKSVDQFQKYTHEFGLGVPTEVPLRGEQDGTEDYQTIAKNYSGMGAMVLASFGQAQRYTTMQLTQYTAAIANGGKRMKPLLVEKKVHKNGKVEKIKPKVLNRSSISRNHFETVQDGMVQVTQPGGTASHLFKNLPFQVAAKTGTSEQDIPGRGRVENAVFIAYAPADQPKVAVAVIVPEGGYGGRAGGPIAEKMLTLYYERFMK